MTANQQLVETGLHPYFGILLGDGWCGPSGDF